MDSWGYYDACRIMSHVTINELRPVDYRGSNSKNIIIIN
jgi:hypothetical protein